MSDDTQANQLRKSVPYGFWSQTNEFSLGSSSANDLLLSLEVPFLHFIK